MKAVEIFWVQVGLPFETCYFVQQLYTWWTSSVNASDFELTETPKSSPVRPQVRKTCFDKCFPSNKFPDRMSCSALRTTVGIRSVGGWRPLDHALDLFSDANLWYLKIYHLTSTWVIYGVNLLGCNTFQHHGTYMGLVPVIIILKKR